MRISFARMLVEVNVTKPLPEEIEVIDPKGRSFQQVVRYDWKPLFCNKCQVIGHVCPPAQRRNDAQQADQKQHSIMPSSSGIKVVETTHNKGKVVYDIPELSLQDFPVICSVPTKNGFESLHRGYRGSKSAPPDKEGGANKRYKQKELRKYLREKYITLAGLTETRVKEHKAHNGSNVVAPNWGLQNNYHSASNGRIWMLWDTSIYIVDKLREDTQLLHYQITMKSTGITCVLTVIYGYNTCEQMRTLWDALKEIAQGVTIPWLICEYFNVKGEYYTWTNKQQSSDRICSRLDRAFGNHDWMMQWGHVVMEYDVPLISDHTPIAPLFLAKSGFDK
ncbi:uncharacterized protein LOC107817887 [Nicotiana tabacum]|uniref:Uncharacterized protein LOC107817887 n=1 Tax=Nicotiana tabacum TaxID=4097 RepID=A0A1S4CDN6_TOBAC